MHGRVAIFDRPERLEEYLVSRWIELAEAAVRDRGRFVAALSGGRTPAGFYRRLASSETDWRTTHLFIVDERCVPRNSAESNYRMIAETLLEHAVVPNENRHFVADCTDAEAAASRYDASIRKFFSLAEGELPRFDLILLGLGEDGHTASLFPGGAAVEEKSRFAVGVSREGMALPRVSLTLPVLNNAREVVFVVTGSTKATAVRRVVVDRDRRLPAAHVEPSGGRLLYACDAAAARLLPPGDEA